MLCLTERLARYSPPATFGQWAGNWSAILQKGVRIGIGVLGCCCLPWRHSRLLPTWETTLLQSFMITRSCQFGDCFHRKLILEYTTCLGWTAAVVAAQLPSRKLESSITKTYWLSDHKQGWIWLAWRGLWGDHNSLTQLRIKHVMLDWAIGSLFHARYIWAMG